MNFISVAFGENLIIPKKKPQISSEEKIISDLKGEILPKTKPKFEEKKTTEIKKKEINKKTLGILIPKNKPLVVTKKKKKLKNKRKF